jgi:hypothetical protein
MSSADTLCAQHVACITERQRISRILTSLASDFMQQVAQQWAEQRDILRTELLEFWHEYEHEFREYWHQQPPSSMDVMESPSSVDLMNGDVEDVRRAMIIAALDDIPDSVSGPLLHCACPELVQLFDMLEQSTEQPNQQQQEQQQQQQSDQPDQQQQSEQQSERQLQPEEQASQDGSGTPLTPYSLAFLLIELLVTEQENDTKHFSLAPFTETIESAPSSDGGSDTQHAPAHQLHSPRQHQVGDQPQQQQQQQDANSLLVDHTINGHDASHMLSPLLVARSCTLLQFALGITLLFTSFYTSDGLEQ